MENDKVKQCLLCGNQVTLIESNLSGYQEPEVFKVYSCPSCHTDFSFPRVDAGSIYDSIYKDAKNVPGYNRYWRFMKKIKKSKHPLNDLSKVEDTYWGVKEALLKVVPDKSAKKILEIGSGLGYLTYSLRRAGYDAVGIDLSDTAVQQANSIFGDYFRCVDLFEMARLQPETYDVIILTEVIEHVNKPLDFIESIKQLLKIDGYAIITTPNKSLFPTGFLWATDLPPVHCWWFSEESMRYAARQKDLEIEFVNFKAFYKRNPLTIDMYRIHGEHSHKPTLNRKGEIIDTITKRKKNYFLKVRSYIYTIPLFKKGYNLLLRIVKKDVLVCNERGYVICAIMHKI